MIERVGTEYVLANGVRIPAIGYGCACATPYPFDKLTNNALYALDHGYRLLDTATQYMTEDAVGAAIERTPLPREELFITTKLHNDNHKNPYGAFEISRQFLRTDYVDLYLIHWPGLPGKWRFVDVWKTFEELYAEGKVRAIGVSNFEVKHLEVLLDNCEIKPMVNQAERHPYSQQKETVEFCKQNDILFQASTPLGNQRADLEVMPLDHPTILRLAEKYHKTPGQISLRWHLDTGCAAVPASRNPQRIQDNISIYDFELSEEDLAEIEKMDIGHMVCPHPDTFFFKGMITTLMATWYAKPE